MPPLIPLAPGALLASARDELERQIAASVPKGKTGAVLTIVDKNGARIGVAACYKGTVTFAAEAGVDWSGNTDASLKLKVVF